MAYDLDLNTVSHHTQIDLIIVILQYSSAVLAIIEIFVGCVLSLVLVSQSADC